MARLKVPSIQHLARTWRSSPQATAGELVKLAINSPVFSYTQLHQISKSLLLRHISYEQAIECVERMRRTYVKEIYLPLLPLLNGYFAPISADYAIDVATRYYAIDQNLIIPFSPTMLYGSSGGAVMPWLSFWKSNPVRGPRLSLFATVVNEILREDADADDVRFEILDFSAPAQTQDRTLRVVPLSTIPLLTDQETIEMLSIFSEGYRLADVALQRIRDEKMSTEMVMMQGNQLNLDFD